MPTLVAIDPSLTGTAVCLYSPEDLLMYTFSSKPSGPELAARLDRFWGLIRKIADCVSPGEPIYLEGYSFGSKGRAMLTLAEFGGLLRNRLAGIGVVTEIPPSSLKKFATGKGNADKLKVAVAVAKRYDVEFASDDEYDAYALARLGACLEGWEQPQTEFQQAVVDDFLKKYPDYRGVL